MPMLRAVLVLRGMLGGGGGGASVAGGGRGFLQAEKAANKLGWTVGRWLFSAAREFQKKQQLQTHSYKPLWYLITPNPFIWISCAVLITNCKHGFWMEVERSLQKQASRASEWNTSQKDNDPKIHDWTTSIDMRHVSRFKYENFNKHYLWSCEINEPTRGETAGSESYEYQVQTIHIIITIIK